MSDITLGIIGSGQLGSMMCQAAKKLNVKTVVMSDDEEGPAQNYCDQFIYSKYDDQIKIKDFINKVDVVTFEFENIPIEILKSIDKEKKVYPKPDINNIIIFFVSRKTFMKNFSQSSTKKIQSTKKCMKNCRSGYIQVSVGQTSCF